MKLLQWVFYQYKTNTFQAIIISLAVILIIMVTFGLTIFGFLKFFSRKAEVTIIPSEDVIIFGSIKRLRREVVKMVGDSRFLKRLVKESDLENSKKLIWEYILGKGLRPKILHLMDDFVKKTIQSIYFYYIKRITGKEVKDMISRIKNIVQLISINYSSPTHQKSLSSHNQDIHYIDEILIKMNQFLKGYLGIVESGPPLNIISMGLLATYNFTSILKRVSHTEAKLTPERMEHFINSYKTTINILKMYGIISMTILNDIMKIRKLYSNIPHERYIITNILTPNNLNMLGPPTEEINKIISETTRTISGKYDVFINLYEGIINQLHHISFRNEMKIDLDITPPIMIKEES